MRNKTLIKERLCDIQFVVLNILKDDSDIKQDISNIKLLIQEIEYHIENK